MAISAELYKHHEIDDGREIKMMNYFKNRGKFFLLMFVIGTVFGYFSTKLFIFALATGVFMALTVGNALYFYMVEKSSWLKSIIRTLKYIAVSMVALIIVGIITS